MASEELNGRRRVVVTGMGAVTPLGNDVETTWANLLAGKRGAGRSRVRHDRLPGPLRLRAEGFRSEAVDRPQAGAAHGPVRADDHSRRRGRRRRTPGSNRRRRPTASALRSPRGSAGSRRSRTATTSCSTAGPTGSTRSRSRDHPEHGRRLGVDGARHARAALVAVHCLCRVEHGDRRRRWTRSGSAARTSMFCGGTEAPVITSVGIAGFGAMRALSRRNDDPEKASRPFDSGRDGFVMGEAGAVMVLEELEHAKARGAKIYAEVLGYGLSSDAKHITEPDPTGVNPARALRMALGRRGHRAERGRLHQRARHVDADRRRGRDARDQARARRGEGARDADLVDEGRHRPLPRRRRRGRGDLHRPRAAATACCRRRSTTRTPIRSATSTTSRTRRARRRTSRSASNNSFGFGGHNACVVFSRY